MYTKKYYPLDARELPAIFGNNDNTIVYIVFIRNISAPGIGILLKFWF